MLIHKLDIDGAKTELEAAGEGDLRAPDATYTDMVTEQPSW